jgi:hypothetical protein
MVINHLIIAAMIKGFREWSAATIKGGTIN